MQTIFYNELHTRIANLKNEIRLKYILYPLFFIFYVVQ